MVVVTWHFVNFHLADPFVRPFECAHDIPQTRKLENVFRLWTLHQKAIKKCIRWLMVLVILMPRVQVPSSLPFHFYLRLSTFDSGIQCHHRPSVAHRSCFLPEKRRKKQNQKCITFENDYYYLFCAAFAVAPSLFCGSAAACRCVKDKWKCF